MSASRSGSVSGARCAISATGRLIAPGMCIAAYDSGDSTSTSTTRPARSAPMSSSRAIVNTLLSGSEAELIRSSSHGACLALDRGTMWARTSLIAVAAVGLLSAAPATVSAQYFGRNKVQYKNLDFQILKTEHFDIYYYPEEREGIDVAARMAERWRTRLARIFGHELRGRQPLVLYASHPDFEQTNAIYGELSEGTGGVTEPLRRRIVLPMGGPLADTDHVIGHELVHAFQFDITTNPNAPPGQNGAERLPLWFIEGMAEYLSIVPVDPHTAMWLRDAVRGSEDTKKAKE